MFGKVYFPRLTMPVSQVLTSLINFLIQAAMYLMFWRDFIASGAETCITLWPLAVPLVMLEVMLLGLGVGIIVSALTTKYRDLAIAVGFGVQLWMYASPVVYPLSMLERMPPPESAGALEPHDRAHRSVPHGHPGHRHGRAWASCTAWFYRAALVLGVVLFSRIEKTFMDTV